MRRYLAGDRAAFSALFTALAPRVHGFFLRSFGAKDVADDLLQTTFLKLHRARDTFRPGAKVRPWVFGIAARVRADELRRRYRVPRSVSDDALDDLRFSVPPPRPEAGQVAARVQTAIAELPESQRVVVLLHRFEGLTFAEIGDALGAAEGAVRIRAFRAYATLRKKLEDLSDVPASTESSEEALT
ncbi:MAG: RNA polymerase sigma factor [Myxococcota bacterium]|nr:RNA polymerase sigma factor [Myxococcota bacterium]